MQEGSYLCFLTDVSVLSKEQAMPREKGWISLVGVGAGIRRR